MPYVKTKDGTEIFYKDWGSGQPLVFHHGWPLSSDDWDASKWDPEVHRDIERRGRPPSEPSADLQRDPDQHRGAPVPAGQFDAAVMLLDHRAAQGQAQPAARDDPVVAARLRNGFVLVESAGAVDKANYREDVGREICLERIKNKIWELEGYQLSTARAADREHV